MKYNKIQNVTDIFLNLIDLIYVSASSGCDFAVILLHIGMNSLVLGYSK